MDSSEINQAPTTEAPDIVLSVQSLRLEIDEQLIFDDVSFDLQRNSMVAIIGPSGSGKTSLLKAIAGLSVTDAAILGGTVQLFPPRRDGNLPDWRKNYETNFAYVSQTPTAFGGSIYSNVALAFEYHSRHRIPRGRLHRTEIDERVEWALKKSQLWLEVRDRLKKPAYALSSGQAQRLCIARALAIRPAVLLLDEPGAHLDVRTLELLEQAVDEVKADTNVIIVTHNLQQAARISDTCLHLLEGRLVEHGATRDVFLKPLRRETEDFVTGRFG